MPSSARTTPRRTDFNDIPPEFEPTRTHPIRVRSRPMPDSVRIAEHTHGWAQLAYASRGVLRVTTPGTTWMVPPSRAIWIPPRVTHEVLIVEEAFLRTLYVDESIVPRELAACRVVEVSGLLREAIAALDVRDLPHARERLLCTLALDEIIRSAPLPLAVPMPREKRLRALCEALLADPAHPGSLEHWAAQVGASSRTIARLFRQELGLSFSHWRQQAILARAIPLLNQGKPMSFIAETLGYRSQSAFSAMFRRAFGQSPRAFIAPGNAPHADGRTDTDGHETTAGKAREREKKTDDDLGLSGVRDDDGNRQEKRDGTRSDRPGHMTDQA
ncbi:AraC family transcriptional regulator [Burkholderia sp. WAC0059]|uniref:AraC family transcriptional regulator n=1 Tax=Burkholderia sp. WAC0059 TaxID=2066022 RepID=UPI000C7E8797|nr:helix-turn-helix transcriptional regulator [Burkholderia sp. WAC0059]PLZ02113.1 AraC family transcriptional regulator [Burkholderia sp. WAC0059]